MPDLALCDNIVYDLYGPVTAKVASLLLYRGRLSFIQLCRLSGGLKPDLVRAALVVLVQQNVCTYFCAPGIAGPSKGGEGETFYTIQTEEIMARLWFGQFISMAEDINRSWDLQQRSDSRAFITAALVHGRIRITDLMDEVYPLDDQSHIIGTQRVLMHLLQNHYLVATSPASTVNAQDRETRTLDQKISTFQDGAKGSATLKQKKAGLDFAREEMEAEMEKEETELKHKVLSAVLSRRGGSTHHANGKRPRAPSIGSDDTEREAKRRAMPNGKPESTVDGIFEIDDGVEVVHGADHGLPNAPYWQSVNQDDIFVRVNYARFRIKIRDKHIEKAVGDRFGPAARQVMRAISALVEDDSRGRSGAQSLLDAAYSPTIMTHTILKRMQYLMDQDKASHSSSVQTLLRDAFVQTSTIPHSIDVTGTWLPDRTNTLNLVAEICKRIGHAGEAEVSADDGGWLKRVESGMHEGPGEERWQVAYHAVNRSLKRAFATGVVHLRHQKEAVRVMRILDTYGRLDEKHVSKIGLIQPKEVRRIIDGLMQAGMVELQEVPKTADRLPSRSFYLWYVDWDRVYGQLRAQVCQQIGNIRTRARAEEAKLRVVRAKSRLPEVQEDKGLLRPDEWEALDGLDERLEWLDVVALRNLSDLTILELKDVIVENDS